jgi:hypothetical protein
MLKISNSLDWSQVETEIKNLGNTLPMFRHDIKHVLNNIRPEITKLSMLEVEDRRSRNTRTRRDCQQQVDKINESLKTFQKFHLMALLGQ